MNKIALLIATVMVLLSGQTQAAEIDTVGMFYIKVPFGQGMKKSDAASTMGFRMEYKQAESLAFSGFKKPAAFEYRFANQYVLPSMKVNGVEVMASDTTYHADGDGGGIDLELAGIALLAVLLIKKSKDDNDDDHDDNPQPQPQQQQQQCQNPFTPVMNANYLQVQCIP